MRRHLYLDCLQKCYLFAKCTPRFLDEVLSTVRMEVFMPDVSARARERAWGAQAHWPYAGSRAGPWPSPCTAPHWPPGQTAWPSPSRAQMTILNEGEVVSELFILVHGEVCAARAQSAVGLMHAGTTLQTGGTAGSAILNEMGASALKVG